MHAAGGRGQRASSPWTAWVVVRSLDCHRQAVPASNRATWQATTPPAAGAPAGTGSITSSDGIRGDVIYDLVSRFVPPNSVDEQWDLQGLQATLTLDELLPHSFGPDHLNAP